MAAATVSRGRDGTVTVCVPAADPLLYADLAVLEDATVAQDSAGTVTIQVAAEHWDTVQTDLLAAGVEVEEAPAPVEGCSAEFATEAIRRVKPGQPLLVTGPDPARLLHMVLTALDGHGRAAVVALGGLPGQVVATTVAGGRPHLVGGPEGLLGAHPETGESDGGPAELTGCSTVVLFGLEHAEAGPLEALLASLRRAPRTARLRLVAVGDPTAGAGSFFGAEGAVEARFEDRVYAVRPSDPLLWRLWCGGSILAGEIARLLPEAGGATPLDCEVVAAAPAGPPPTAQIWVRDARPGGGGGGGGSEVARPTARQQALLARLAADAAELGGPAPLAPGALVQLLGPAGQHPPGAVGRLAALGPDDRCSVVIGEEQVEVEPIRYELSARRQHAGKGRPSPPPRRETARVRVPGVRGVQPIRIPTRGGVLVPKDVRLVLPTAAGELDAGELLRLRGCGGALVRRGAPPDRLRPHGCVPRCRELLDIPSRDYSVERVAPTSTGGFERFPYDDVFAKAVDVPHTFVPLCELYVRARRHHEQQERRFVAAARKRQSAAVNRTLKKQRCCRNVDRDAGN